MQDKSLEVLTKVVGCSSVEDSEVDVVSWDFTNFGSCSSVEDREEDSGINRNTSMKSRKSQVAKEILDVALSSDSEEEESNFCVWNNDSSSESRSSQKNLSPFSWANDMSWASEMSLIDKLPPSKALSMDGVGCTRLPRTNQTPKDFQEVNCKQVKADTNSINSPSFSGPEMAEKVTSDIVVNHREEEQKADVCRCSIHVRPNRAEHWYDKEMMKESIPINLSSQELPVDTILEYRNLIINYIPSWMNSNILCKLFLPFGNIVSSKVVVNRASGLSKGYGFVKFQTGSEGRAAQKAMNKYKIGKKTLKVSFSRHTQFRKTDLDNTNLRISNLDPKIESSGLEKQFRTCGYVVQCRVLRDLKGMSKQIAFVRFGNTESAKLAIDRFDGKKLEGSDKPMKIRIMGTAPLPPRRSTEFQISSPVNLYCSSCYVSGFDESISKADLRRVFSVWGEDKIKSLRIIRRRNDPYAFINFYNGIDAAVAAKTLNNTYMRNFKIIVRLQV